MATARLLGRTTASTGAVEEISVGAGLSLSGGSLTNSQATFPAPTTSTGVGQWRTVLPDVNNETFLPSGGTWAYFTTNVVAGVAAGGTLISTTGGSGLAWRIA
jgi:hypothetical protein